MTDHRVSRRWGGLSIVVAVGLQLGVGTLAEAQALRPSAQPQRPATAAAPATGTVDYIVVLVNSEPVTNFDVRQRLLRVEQQLASQGQALPPREQLLPQVLEQLVVERAQLQQASELGMRVDEATLLQAEQAIAAQNQLDLEAFRRRVVSEGLDLNRLRNELRNQVLLQRLREREVEARVRVSEADIDSFIRERQSTNPEAQEINLGHVLIQVPEGASAARVSELQVRAQGVADRLRAGADLAVQAREHSESPEAASGGQMGLRPVGRLPELFVEATRSLPTGGVAGPLRSAAGFHVLKVIERRQSTAPDFTVTQSRARHILLRPGPQLSQADAVARLAQYRQQIASGQATFETLARQHSQDGSAREGGDLGWVSPGQFVPEFEQAMNALRPGEMSQPVVSRFGVHLIRLDERRQTELSEREQRDLARDLVREQKSEEALRAWSEDVRGRAFVEQREAPQL
ncbi:MAG: peptidylprolyl isomerase [Hydrogenophaga sp.]|uniref:peptidylprolyl isomerase n=1 Tax=Hydrogenophaga sp. TaxID=1904254 RepID=UPI0025BDD0ED|nr:peptidylprolyl isomerase [Hydrogenophaga sp.]MBT9551555.1 peptidylprolyl isomerase [Hydrogenophaga sp.]